MSGNPADGESTLQLLQKYSRILNGAPEAKLILAQDEEIATFLLKTLTTYNEASIVRTALEILWELVSFVGNKTKSVLCSNLNCKATFNDIVQNGDVNIVFLCGSISDYLFSDNRAASNGFPEVDTSKPRAQRFLPVSRQQPKVTMVFQAEEFANSDTKRIIEKRVVLVKGVFSIYFDSSSSRICRCIIRASNTVTPQTIAEAILATKRLSSLNHVIKDELGDETLDLYQTDEKADDGETRISGKTPSLLPAYLNEDDYTDAVMISDGAVAVFGDNGDTKKGGGWLSGVSSFFSKTLYW